MKGTHWTMLVTVAILSLVVAGCGPSAIPVPPTATPTRAPPSPTPIPTTTGVPGLVSVRPTAGSPVLHPQWTSYTNASGVRDLLPVGNDLWVASSGGVRRWNLVNGTCVKYNTEHGLAANGVTAIAVDGEGVLSFGTWGGGVSRFDPLTEGEAWTTYSVEDGLADDAGHRHHL